MNALLIAPTADADTAAPRRAASRRWLVAGAMLLLVVLPFLLSPYRCFQLTLVMATAISLLGLNLLIGWCGQISLGHGAFYAIGAYAAAILIGRFGVPYGLTIPFAALLCGVAGYLFARPVLRLEGHYLALATFALGVATPQLLKSRHIEAWTGGVQGLLIDKPDAPFGLPLAPDRWLYLLTLAVLLVAWWVAANLVRSRIGLALVAIRDAPLAAHAMGVDVAHTKAKVFALSAAFTGMAGALSAVAVQFVAPDSFAAGLSISLLVGVVVGGQASLTGAIYGALFVQFVPAVADQVSKAAPWAIYGLFLIGVVWVMPRGIDGAVRFAWRRITAAWHARTTRSNP
jgi:branched-chain amino acid transport system permease protein